MNTEHPPYQTKLLDARSNTASAIEEAAMILRSGELVAFPTETVYGLGARVFDEQQIAKIYQAKGRPADNPLIAHIYSPEQAITLCRRISPLAERLMLKFFPGPLTLVCPKSEQVPASVSAGLDSIAFRMPALKLTRDLIRLAEQPLVAPSANRSGRPSPTTAQHVLADLEGRIAAVVDGGACALGLESTVLSLLDETQPRLLRPGSIRAEELEDFLHCHITRHTESESEAAHSPGMKYRHYAPGIAVILVESLEVALAMGPTTLVLAPANSPTDTNVRPLEASTLYAEFRNAELQGFERIAVVQSAALEADAALMNRIRKACSSGI